MKLLEVAPLTSVKSLSKLSYFSNLDIEVGDLVEIKIGNRTEEALVYKVLNLKENKLELKESNFKLKKIEKIKIKNFVEENLMNHLNYSSSLVGANISQILYNYLPKNLNLNKINLINSKLKREINYLSLNRGDYISIIKQKIREKKLKQESLIIFCSTIIGIKELYNKLENENIYIYHSDLKKKDEKKIFKSLEEEKYIHLITTPNLLMLYSKNLSEIILYEEESRYYKHNFNKIDFRNFLIYFTEKLNIDLTLFNITPSLESYLEARKIKQNPIYFEEEKLNNLFFINMQEKNKKNYSFYLSQELKYLLDQVIQKNKKAFLYVKRKGLFTSLICADCGEIVRCDDCNKNYILIEKEKERYLRCIDCKKEIKIKEEIICKKCNSINIKSIGIATSGLKEELEQIYPKEKIFLIDKDNIKNKKDYFKTYKSFEETGGILIGTEMAIPILKELDFIAIVSIDSYFFLPEYKIEENIFIIINELLFKLHKKGKMLIQSRIESDIWNYIENKNFNSFYEKELENRKQNNLPPFTIMLSFDLEEKIDFPKEIENKIIEKYYFKNKNLIKNIVLVKKDIWQNEANLREFFIDNFSENNLEINPEIILK